MVQTVIIYVYWTVYHCDIWRIITNKTKQWSCATAASLHTKLGEPHPNFNTQQSKNNTANGLVQQHSRKLLKVDILMLETCWLSKKKWKYNKWHLVCFLFFKYLCVCVSHHSSPSMVRVSKHCSYTFTPAFSFIAWTETVLNSSYLDDRNLNCRRVQKYGTYKFTLI